MGRGAFKEGHGDGFQHYSIAYPAKKLGVLLMSNSDNAEGMLRLYSNHRRHLHPTGREQYIPYDRPRSENR